MWWPQFKAVQKLKDRLCLTEVTSCTGDTSKPQLILTPVASLPLLPDSITRKERNHKLMTIAWLCYLIFEVRSEKGWHAPNPRANMKYKKFYCFDVPIPCYAFSYKKRFFPLNIGSTVLSAPYIAIELQSKK